jgi:hypothetical protein
MQRGPPSARPAGRSGVSNTEHIPSSRFIGALIAKSVLPLIRGDRTVLRAYQKLFSESRKFCEIRMKIFRRFM